MSINNLNKDYSKDQDPHKLFEGAEIPWKKSRKDVWAEMAGRMEDKDEVLVLKRNISFVRLAIAASVIILFGVPSLMRFYTKTVECGVMEHIDLVLPDGSKVALNAETEVKYNPMWWRFARDIKLDGEAYFEVVKGGSFIVESEKASTSVLGTSFNIVSRDERYEVTCLTGKVKVFTANNSSEILLSPNQKAVLGAQGGLETRADIPSEQSISWTDDEFFFTSVPLRFVFEEIERQYGISIASEIHNGLIYTGNFSRNQEIDNILDLVCKPFGIKFEMTKQGTYLILKDEQIQ